MPLPWTQEIWKSGKLYAICHSIRYHCIRVGSSTTKDHFGIACTVWVYMLCICSIINDFHYLELIRFWKSGNSIQYVTIWVTIVFWITVWRKILSQFLAPVGSSPVKYCSMYFRLAISNVFCKTKKGNIAGKK